MSQTKPSTHIPLGAVAQGASEASTGSPSDDPQIEFDALVKIVEMQAQALNDVILSANNLQARVAALEEQRNATTNGDKKRLISLS